MVILSQVLACDATLGYEDLFNTQVLKFNGNPVRNLHHLAHMTASCTDPFMRFDLDYNVRSSLLDYGQRDQPCVENAPEVSVPAKVVLY